MSLKIRALALGCLAMLTAAAVAVDASGTAGGHFGSNKAKTTLIGLEPGANHTLEIATFGGGITCSQNTYHGSVVGMKFVSATLTPTYKGCTTTNDTKDIPIVTHDCTYEFTVRSPEPEVKHSTMHIRCPAGKSITITHPSCTITVPPQTLSGVVYTKTQWEGTEALTIDFTIKGIQYTEHGFCGAFGTTRNDGELKGALILKAWDAEKFAEKVGANITVT